MCKVLAVANQKGGVAKTTTAINLSTDLARKGKKVLLVDMDPQGSATVSLGFKDSDIADANLSTIMFNLINDKTIEKGYGIYKTDEGVDLLPTNIELAGIEVTLVNVMSRELILREFIDGLRDDYDYIILDCAPSLGILTINALCSADSVIIPLQAAYLSFKGLNQLISTITKIKRQINPKLRIEGILVTMVDFRANHPKDVIRNLRENYGNVIPVFKNVIPMSVKASESTAVGKSILAYDSKCKVAEAYKGLTEEVLSYGE